MQKDNWARSPVAVKAREKLERTIRENTKRIGDRRDGMPRRGRYSRPSAKVLEILADVGLWGATSYA